MSIRFFRPIDGTGAQATHTGVNRIHPAPGGLYPLMGWGNRQSCNEGNTLARENGADTQPFPVPALPVNAQWNDGDGVPVTGVSQFPLCFPADRPAT